jgi:uncharacterized protein YdeI (YjbR/CyaY-like superfamily)
MADSGSAKVDAYIAAAAPFARPVLAHLRTLVHAACPEAQETLKWQRPFFLYRGGILANMAAFQRHCSFGFWGTEMAAVLADDRVPGAMGSLGRIATLADLPPDERMLVWIGQARGFLEAGEQQSPMRAKMRVVKAEGALPPAFEAALAENPEAAATFTGFPPGARREYIGWIVEAKRPETRARRIAQAIAWLAEGKQRHWKYEDRS